MKDNYIVKPVAKALQVLEYVVEEGRELTLTEIAYRTGLPKTTAFRYLQTLHQAGFISYDSHSDRYRTGVRIWALAQTKGSQSILREAALPLMRDLRDRFNETINLAELDGQGVVYIEMVESRRSLRMLAKIGSRDPAYCTAVGKAMLAFIPQQEQKNLFPLDFELRTATTIQSQLALEAELLQTRERGYALDIGENEEDSYCIGVPLFYPAGKTRAGLSLSAPATRMTTGLGTQIATALMEASQTLSAILEGQDSRMPL